MHQISLRWFGLFWALPSVCLLILIPCDLDSVRVCCSAQERVVESVPSEQAEQSEEQARSHARDLSSAFKNASQVLLPSVVTVMSRPTAEPSTLANLQLLTPEEMYPNVGSGVIWNAEGLIVTNNHVIRDAAEVMVRLFDGTEIPAKNFVGDASSDLAILHVDSESPLIPAAIANSDQIEVGDWVIAIGSPFNFDQTVSAGIISGKSRVIRGLLAGQLLQTDASINPGNSGGPLANLDGEVVGINTVIASRTGFSQGVGFAIPANRVRWIVRELESHGMVRRAKIGLRAEPLTAEFAREVGIPQRGGVYVAMITKGMPAEEAGILAGDIITSVANQKVSTPAEFAEIIEQLAIDQPIPIEILRDGERRVVTATLVAAHESSKN